MKNAQILYEYYFLKSIGFSYTNNQNNKKINSQKSLAVLQKEINSCFLCELCKTRTNTVFGEGDENADIMLVGEAPGFHEDKQARVFVGRSGQLLRQVLEEIGLNNFYITNIAKCRPPENRNPTLKEANICIEYLKEQIAIIKPKVIISLGSVSYSHLMHDYNSPISRVRGEIMFLEKIKLIPTFHPSYLLRNPSLVPILKQDILKAKNLLKEINV